MRLLEASDRLAASARPMAAPLWLCCLIGLGLTAGLVALIVWVRVWPLHLSAFCSVSLYLMLAPLRGSRTAHEVLATLVALLPPLLFVVLLVQRTLADPQFAIVDSGAWTAASALVPVTVGLVAQALAMRPWRAAVT